MGVQIDERGIRITGTLDGGLDRAWDIRFNGHRVWSFRPRRDGHRLGRGLLVPWPRALAGLLQGHAEIDVVPHHGGSAVFAGSVRFTGSDEPLVLVDDLGHPLSLDKVGRLQRTFEDPTGAARGELIAAGRRVLADLREACGLEVLLCYGGLLGAARNGALVGHDLDLAFVSSSNHPFDVIGECREAERIMASRGWQVVRMSAASFKIWVPLAGGKRAGVDVFSAFWVRGAFHLTASLSGALPREAVLPLGEVVLEGERFPAPADVPAFLAFTYGPDWAVPDPAFRFDHPEANVRKMAHWFRGTRTRLSYWQGYYQDRRRADPVGPSEFARWAAERMAPRSRVVELGSGNGRDAVWLIGQGHPTIGSDFCGAARTAAHQTARDAGVQAEFRSINTESLYSALTQASRLAAEPGTRDVYARGLIDALAPSGREGLWRFCAITGRRGGRTFLEFRTTAGQGAITAEIERHGGTVVEQAVEHGLARLVVSWEKP